MIPPSVLNWLGVAIAVINAIVIPAVLSHLRQPREILRGEIMKEVKRTIEDHNLEASAHPTHGRVGDLEQQFKELIKEMQKLNTAMAVLTERLGNYQNTPSQRLRIR